MNPEIRPLRAEDKEKWLQLWEGYTRFYKVSIEQAVTERTWSRMLDETSPIYCRVAELNGEAVGFVIFVLHEGTWVTTPVCYLEDLFVAETMRGQGIASRLINHLHAEGKAQGWSRLYWHTAKDNPARKLYNRFIEADEYVRYRMHL